MPLLALIMSFYKVLMYWSCHWVHCVILSFRVSTIVDYYSDLRFTQAHKWISLQSIFRMAEAQLHSQPFDLSTYDYDPSCPISSNQGARDYGIATGPCQPTDLTCPRTRNGRRFLTAWNEKFKWIEFSRKTDKAFCFLCRTFIPQVRLWISSF